MGCKNCEYAPKTYEEYCMAFAHPEQYCPDAFTEIAMHCNNYDESEEE